MKLYLEKELVRLKLLPKATGTEGKEIAQQWDVYRRKLRELATSGGTLHVRNQVIEPLQALLGYSKIGAAPDVQTREDLESGGALLTTEDSRSTLRVWTTSFDEDLYAPSKRGRAYRYQSPPRCPESASGRRRAHRAPNERCAAARPHFRPGPARFHNHNSP